MDKIKFTLYFEPSDDLHERLSALSVRDGRSMNKQILHLLREAVQKAEKEKSKPGR